MSINRVLITGNLTRDGELRSTASGMYILNLGVAVNDRRRNQQTGEWEDYPNYIDCVMFGNRAQSLSNYLVKGTKVAIEGKLRWSQWEKDGQKRSKIEVVVDELEFLSSRNSNGGGYAGGNGGNAGGYGGGYAGGNSGNYGGGYAPAQQMQPQAEQVQPMQQAQPQAAAMPPIDTNSSVYDDEIPF